eukprot:Unigene12596_Nuclearia_a/m.38273 Unigene12596_Nuclearia_a/g.38273  ORF Unigene12596_Nuclearia_a/g.38273 Unigene12596_Nuclearia_a/m.38273 type:complete len:112 (-) Unigene12596_Nuclearia_a:259-594(-)
MTDSLVYGSSSGLATSGSGGGGSASASASLDELLAMDDVDWGDSFESLGGRKMSARTARQALAVKDDKKLAHSATERRYRQELNTCINELKALVPACAHASNPNKASPCSR